VHRIAVFAAAALVLPCGTAGATQQGVAAIANWKLMDKCAKEAQVAYPDNSAEANAKRDVKLKDCLSRNNLPPRQPYSAQPPH
jgi:hypothetical protein